MCSRWIRGINTFGCQHQNGHIRHRLAHQIHRQNNFNPAESGVGLKQQQHQVADNRQCYLKEEAEDGRRRCNCMDGSLMRFPPGYRFQPLDEELLINYLKRKVNDQILPYQDFMSHKIREVELYAHNPEELIANHKLDYGEKDWYFFTPRFRKYRNGNRPNRAAGDGYWKATGADKKIFVEGNIVGYRKALVFYKGKPPKGDKTNWIMHEFTIGSSSNSSKPKNKTQNHSMKLDRWVLCKIYKKVDRVPLEIGEGEEVQQPEFIPNNAEMHDISAPANIAAVPNEPQGLSFQPNPRPAPTSNIPLAPHEPQRFTNFPPEPRYIVNGPQGNLQDVGFRYPPPLPTMPRVNNNLIHNNNNMFRYNQPLMMTHSVPAIPVDSYVDYNNNSYYYDFGGSDSQFQTLLSVSEMCQTYPYKSDFVNGIHSEQQSTDSFSENEFKYPLPLNPEESDPTSHLSFDSPRQQQQLYVTELNDAHSSPPS